MLHSTGSISKAGLWQILGLNGQELPWYKENRPLRDTEPARRKQAQDIMPSWPSTSLRLLGGEAWYQPNTGAVMKRCRTGSMFPIWIASRQALMSTFRACSARC